MVRSTFLKYFHKKIDESLFVNLLQKKISPFFSLFYAGVFFVWIKKSFFFTVNGIKRLKYYSFISTFFSTLDIKSYILFFFVIGQIIFPGYGSQDSGGAFFRDSPAASIGNRLGFFSNFFIFIFLLFLLFVVLFKDLVKKPKLFSFSAFEIILLLFLISLEVSSVFSTYPAISFYWFVKVCRGILIYIIFSRIIINKKYLTIISLSFLFIICIQTFLAVAQFLNNGLLGLPIETAGEIINPRRFYLQTVTGSVFRPMGTLAQPNVLSFFFAFAAPFALFFLYSKNKLTKLFALFSTLLLIFGSLITFSRWGIITLFFSITIFFFLSYMTRASKSIMKLLATFAFLILVFFLVFSKQSNFITRFFQFSFEDASFSKRLNLVIQAVYVFIHNPWLGIGGGTFPKYIINFDYTPQNISLIFPASVHSLFLLFLSEGGVFSFIIFLVIVFYFTISFFQTMHKLSTLKDNFYLLFTVALFASFLTYLFNGIWELRTLDEHLIVLFWMNIGLYFNIARLNKFG